VLDVGGRKIPCLALTVALLHPCTRKRLIICGIP
jgi:hypothetical protein